MKRILLLGAGLVAPPLIRYFLGRRGDFRLLVASNDFSRVAHLLEEGAGEVSTVHADLSDAAALTPLISEADVVVSLLPAAMLPAVAQRCVEVRVPLVNTSYRSPAVLALHHRAREAGVLLLSEVGLDPGLDHMSAMRTIAELKRRGATIRRFMSCGGGLPALDANINPWGYKFSWSPRAVLLAGRQDARYLSGGEIVEIAGTQLFSHHWPYEVIGEGVFEIYPNRDSLGYVDHYGLEDAVDVFRGTIRYPGWCETMLAAAKLGFFDLQATEWKPGTTYGDFSGRLLPDGQGPLVRRIARFLAIDEDSPVMTRLEWAGLLSDRPIQTGTAAPLEVFLARLQKLMTYGEGERDMVALQHHFTAEYPDGRTDQLTTSLVEVAERWGDSAMARTVSIPAAIAARLVAEGQLHLSGSHLPTFPEIYEPLLDELAETGIRFKEIEVASYPQPFSS